MDRAPHLQDQSSETGDNPELEREHEPEGFDYKEVAREVLARIDQRLADMERDDPSDVSEPRIRSQTVNDIMNSDREAALVRMAGRGLIGLLLGACLVAAISFLWSHMDMARPIVAEGASRFELAATAPADKQEPVSSAASKATAEVPPAQAVPVPRTASDNDNPNPAPVPPELAELMRKVDRNVADLAQAVTEFRLARQQAADDNAKTVEDIKTSLDQIVARAMARTAMARTPTQATAMPRPPAPPSLATAPRPRRPVPMVRSSGEALESDVLR